MTSEPENNSGSGLPSEMRGEFLERFLDQLDEIVLLLDEERKLVWANKAAQARMRFTGSSGYGRLVGEAIGCLHSEESGCGSSSWCPCGISARIDDAQTCAAEAMRETISIPVRTDKAIEVRNFLVTAMPMTLDCDGLPKVCVIMDDRTQLVRRTDEIGLLNDRLERRALQVESLTETILHDVRSPLLSIISSLSTNSGDPPSLEAMFEIGNLRLAIENLLRISQMDTEGFPLSKEIVDAAIVVGETVDLMRNEALPEGTVIEFTVPEDPLPGVSADRKVLAMVIENLVRNLIAGAGNGARVKTAVQAKGPMSVQVTVSGGASPIPHDLLESIFDPEFHLKRPDSAGRRNKGLPFCRMAMVAQGGNVIAEILEDGSLAFRVTLSVRRKSTEKI